MFRLNGGLWALQKSLQMTTLRTYASTIGSLGTTRVRRVLFNVPGSDEKKIMKATTLDLDCVVLDLEDGVAPNKKEAARDLVRSVLLNDEVQFGRAERLVRINAVDSEHLEADLHMISRVAHRLDGLVIPKVESAAHLAEVRDHLAQHIGEDADSLALLAAVESALGIVNLREISAFGHSLQALIFASEDYAADTGKTRTPGGRELLYARSAVQNYARAFGLQAIDMVCIDYKNPTRLADESREGVEMGFDGKQAIHPAQIQGIYDAWKPDTTTLEYARKILESATTHMGQGRGAWEVDGKMIDLPMVKWAQKIVLRAQ